MERVFVYIDGRNFFYRLKAYGIKDYNLDLVKFSQMITGINLKRKLEQIYYYNSSLKYHISPSLFKKQQRYFAKLRLDPLVEVRLCKRQWRSGFSGNPTSGKTVGDDVWLVCDMLQDANDDNYDIAIIVSCDGDYIYLVDYVQRLKKKVENAFFVGMGAIAVKKECDGIIPIDPTLCHTCLY